MRTRSVRIAGLATIVLVLLVGAMSVAADSKPKLKGDWKINVGKSEFGILFAPKSANVKISQKGSQLKIVDSETNEQGETNQKESSYTIDGKEETGTLIATPFPVVGAMKWKEGSLTFEGSGTNSGVTFHVQEKWGVSADGKRITIDRHFSSDRRNTDQKIVLQK